MPTVHRPARLRVTPDRTVADEVSVGPLPDLPVIDWSSIGERAPTLLPTPADHLPKADAVVVTWAGAEWAALQHVFCSSDTVMPYSRRHTSHWPGWQKHDAGFPTGGPSDWTYWGYYRLVQVGTRKVLLYKSNTHLDWPGRPQLEQLTTLLLQQVGPTLLVSTGTAGGTRPDDHVGTVRTTTAGTLYEKGKDPSSWPTYRDSWRAPGTVAQRLASLLLRVPTDAAGLTTLAQQLNRQEHASYDLATLNPGDLNSGEASPKVIDETGGTTSLLTASTFVVGDTAGTYQNFSCVEMDDAILAEICERHDVGFASVRNLSDPAQNAALPPAVQAAWGSLVYSTYGLYTSYNGALATFAYLAGGA